MNSATNTATDPRTLTNEERVAASHRGFAEDLRAGDVRLANAGRIYGFIDRVSRDGNSIEISMNGGRVTEWTHSLEIVRYLR